MARRARWILASLALIGSLVASGVGAPAAQPQPAEAAPPPDSDESPRDEHARLADLCGAWSTAATLSIDGAPAGPAEAGIADIAPMMGGRFIAIRESGQLMGEAFEALKILGFNNAAGLYEATWVYTGSTAMMRARGIMDPQSGVLTFQAQYASGPDASTRFIITLLGRSQDAPPEQPVDRFTITLAALMPDGTAGPVLETTYTRVVAQPALSAP